MGNRYSRKKTRKWKMQQQIIKSEDIRNNGYRWCHARQQQISIDVCVVEQGRKPARCVNAKCPYFKEAA
jgi:hypothetical protein